MSPRSARPSSLPRRLSQGRWEELSPSDVAALKSGLRLEGRFVINIDGVDGMVAGDYQVVTTKTEAQLELQPQDAWQPPDVEGPPWVSTYRWRAGLKLDGDRLQLTARWSRTSE